MQHDRITPQDGTGRVLRFRPRAPVPRRSPVEGIDKYERPGRDQDDYRHRMTVNVFAFAVLLLLVVAGVWLAIKIAELRRDQDCVLAGRRNCAQISIPGDSR